MSTILISKNQIGTVRMLNVCWSCRNARTDFGFTVELSLSFSLCLFSFFVGMSTLKLRFNTSHPSSGVTPQRWLPSSNKFLPGITATIIPIPHPTSPPLFLLHFPLFPLSVLSKHQRDLSYPNGLNLLTGNKSRSIARPLTSRSHVTMCSCNDCQGRGSGRVEIFSGGACSLCRTVRGPRRCDQRPGQILFEMWMG